ncbi:MAG: hypothetical protein QM757_16880 [Paludibaculum sp.]
MDWFKLQKKVTAVKSEEERHIRTEGLWIKCDSCRQIIWRKDLEETLQCCPKCGHHFRIDARTRLNYLMDEGVWQEHDTGMMSSDPLEFVDSKPYKDRLAGMQKNLGMKDAVISATGKIQGRQVHICAMELKFIGGTWARSSARRSPDGRTLHRRQVPAASSSRLPAARACRKAPSASCSWPRSRRAHAARRSQGSLHQPVD